MRLTPLYVHAPTPFRIINSGKTPAKNVVAEIVEFWHELDAGNLVKLEQFLPCTCGTIKLSL